MYLNAILMDIELAPRVEEDVRVEAIRQTEEEEGRGEPTGGNARREARQRELELVRAAPRGSIWTNRTRLDADILYLRPPRHVTDSAIDLRSSEIVSKGIPEARHLAELARAGSPPTPQVVGSIGVRELMEYLEAADNDPAQEEAARVEEARHRISVRTRQLARRQVRWFDKMTRTLQDAAVTVTVAEGSSDPNARGFIEGSVCAADA
jgi:tRNA dimethylallyltransferase